MAIEVPSFKCDAFTSYHLIICCQALDKTKHRVKYNVAHFEIRHLIRNTSSGIECFLVIITPFCCLFPLQGAMFEDKRLIRSFLTATDNVNRDPNVLPGVQLETIINITKPQDAFDSLKAGMYATLKSTTYLMHFYFSSTSVSIHMNEFCFCLVPRELRFC